MHLVSFAFLIFVYLFVTACAKPVFKFDRFKHNRELATLKEKFPTSSIQILRELNRNIKRTRTGLRLVISMERELKRAARHIETSNFDLLKWTVEINDEYRNPPFSS